MPEKDEPWYTRPHHIKTVTNHPKSAIDDLCAIQHIDSIQQMYKNKGIEEEIDDLLNNNKNNNNNIKELNFKREYDKIDNGIERNKKQIMDKINTFAINESIKIESNIQNLIETYKNKEIELKQKFDTYKSENKDYQSFKSFQGGNEIVDFNNKTIQYNERNNVYVDPLRTTKIMSDT